MKKTLLAAVIAGAVSVSAQAATISHNFDFAESTTEISKTGSLGLFDSSLGTLTGAVLSLGASATFEFTGTNKAAQSQTAKLTASSDISWITDLGALTPLLIGSNFDLSATSGVQSYATGETHAFGPEVDSKNGIVNLSTILASLQASGGGTFGLTCNSLSGLSVVGGGGNISTTQATQAGCGASIVYTYDEAPPPGVPAPATVALLGLGLLGVGAARRRKA